VSGLIGSVISYLYILFVINKCVGRMVSAPVTNAANPRSIPDPSNTFLFILEYNYETVATRSLQIFGMLLVEMSRHQSVLILLV
jgi:hypothetical protein